MLVMVMVKPAVSPALIGLASAVLTTVTSGQKTSTWASAELLPVADSGSFEAETVTVFGSVPQSL